MKNVGDAGFSRKRGGNAGSVPPFQTLFQSKSLALTEHSPSVFVTATVSNVVRF